MLDGIFSEAVVVVEADTDRAVYQAALETLRNDIHLDIHFSAVGGTGGIADTCHLYRTLKIPIAVIADLDLLMDNERLRNVLKRLVDETKIVPLLERAADIGNRIKFIPPMVSPDDVRDRLSGVLSAKMDWSKGDDIHICKQTREIANQLDRVKQLKRGGILHLPKELQSPVEEIVRDLSEHGLFLVPVGELECWFDEGKVPVSKQSKWAWANSAAAYIRGAGPLEGGIWDFIRGVAHFLRQ